MTFQGLSAPIQWSKVFHASQISRYAWVVADDWEDRVWEVVRDAGLPNVHHNVMFGDLSDSVALLDGLVIYLSNYGFPGGLLPSGTRVIGPWVLRWLCARLKVVPPSRKLSTEDRVPDAEELASMLQEQLQGPEALRERAQLGFVNDRDGLLQAVGSLFGDAAARRDPDSYPAKGRLGQAGFTWAQADTLRKAGATEEDALRWLTQGFSPRIITELGGKELTKALAWKAILPDANSIPALLNANKEPQEGEVLRDAGCPRDAIAEFVLRGLGLAEWERWSPHGIEGDSLEILISHGVPASEGLRWKRLELERWRLSRVFEAGADLEKAEAFKRCGIDPETWYEWFSAGVDVEECVRWTTLGVLCYVAITVRKAGYGPEDVAFYKLNRLKTAQAMLRRLQTVRPR